MISKNKTIKEQLSFIDELIRKTNLVRNKDVREELLVKLHRRRNIVSRLMNRTNRI